LSFPLVLRGDGFQHAHRGRADGDDAASGIFCVVHRANGFFANFKPLLRAFCGRRAFRFSPAKSAGADVQRDEADFHAARADLFQNSGVKCKPAVGAATEPSVWRKRFDNVPCLPAVGCRVGCKAASGISPSRSKSADIRRAGKLQTRDDLRNWLRTVAEIVTGLPSAVAKMDLSSEGAPFAGTHHRPPVVGGVFFEQQNLKLSAGFGVDAAQSPESRANCSAPARRPRAKIPASREPPVFDAVFAFRCKTRRRDSSRLGAGCCAINSGGSSKSKSAVRIARVSSLSKFQAVVRKQVVRGNFRIVNNF
jgi:hypothetical protein